MWQLGFFLKKKEEAVNKKISQSEQFVHFWKQVWKDSFCDTGNVSQKQLDRDGEKRIYLKTYQKGVDLICQFFGFRQETPNIKFVLNV